MRIWSTLIAVILLLVLAFGLSEVWPLLRDASLADVGWRLWAVLAGASVLPALGLVAWLRARPLASIAANLFLVVAALGGAACAALLWLLRTGLEG